MKRDELERITSTTLRSYEQNARAFWEGTRDHDVTQNYEAFLRALPARPLKILDLGCGPGRDVAYFCSLGHTVVGLDGCEAFCQMASQVPGAEIRKADFLELDLEAEEFDGIFCNATLQHVPSEELQRVLAELRRALKPGGVLFISVPRGEGEGWCGARFSHWMEWEELGPLLGLCGFLAIDHYYRPQGAPREKQPWLAVVCRRGEE